MVVSDPEIMRGTPVFKGTRIPRDLVADMLAQGATADEILEAIQPGQGKMPSPPLYMRASAARPAQPPPLAGEKRAAEDPLH